MIRVTFHAGMIMVIVMVMMLLWISVGKTIILAGTMKGQLGDMSIIPTQILQTKKHTYHKPLDSVVITSTDKTKRLVAINTTQCKDILRKSTIATGNHQSLTNLERDWSSATSMVIKSPINTIRDTLNYAKWWRIIYAVSRYQAQYTLYLRITKGWTGRTPHLCRD